VRPAGHYHHPVQNFGLFKPLRNGWKVQSWCTRRRSMLMCHQGERLQSLRARVITFLMRVKSEIGYFIPGIWSLRENSLSLTCWRKLSDIIIEVFLEKVLTPKILRIVSSLNLRLHAGELTLKIKNVWEQFRHVEFFTWEPSRNIQTRPHYRLFLGLQGMPCSPRNSLPGASADAPGNACVNP